MTHRYVRVAAVVFSLSVCLSAGKIAVQRGGRGPQTPPPSPLVDGDFTIKPPFANASELLIDLHVPHGEIHRFLMKSEDSKIYKGISRAKPGEVVPYERPVAVYVPAQYVQGTAAPFIVVQDGYNPKYALTIPTILDNLIAQKKVPPIVAVMIQHGGGDGPGSERGLEYDTVSDKYTTFVETEVLPRIEKDFNVRLTKDPDGRATMGGSSGAACAFTMAWSHPELYRRVISYSGTFVNQENPQHPEISRGAWEYHASLIPNSPPKPIRIWMEVGGEDNGAASDEASLHNWVIANRHMAVALKEKGYHYRFVFAEGARHTDANVIYQTLPDALQYVWQGYGGSEGKN
jgi:enterochelin esterase family protein